MSEVNKVRSESTCNINKREIMGKSPSVSTKQQLIAQIHPNRQAMPLLCQESGLCADKYEAMVSVDCIPQKVIGTMYKYLILNIEKLNDF